MQQINDLFNTVLNGSTKYISEGIQSTTNRSIFTNEADKIKALTYQYPDLTELKKHLGEARKQILYVEKYPWSFFASYRKYKSLAYDNALDIVNCLEKRFVTGTESEYCFIKPGNKLYVG